MDGRDREAILFEAARTAGFEDRLSRRGFLKLTAFAAGAAFFGLGEALGADPPLVVLEIPKGLILVDHSRCVGCQRCELACVEFNDGKAQPSLARIKVGHVLDYGPQGPAAGFGGHGAFGDGLTAPELCRQCPPPAPCASACPENAIVLDPKTGVRMVEASRCVGCRSCQEACPFDMIVFDERSQKASKCFLCGGAPKCVEACPAGALRFAPASARKGRERPCGQDQARREGRPFLGERRQTGQS